MLNATSNIWFRGTLRSSQNISILLSCDIIKFHNDHMLH
jgi:hypothetical protein